MNDSTFQKVTEGHVQWLSALHDDNHDDNHDHDHLPGPPVQKSDQRTTQLLDHLNRGLFLSVEKDCLTVKYKGMGSDSQDVGVIRAKNAMKGLAPIEYFEVTVLETNGTNLDMAIGVSKKSMVTTRHVGFCSHSWGYLSTDGRKYQHSHRYGLPYGPKYDKGDVVGCGVNWIRREMFFTHNGNLLGTAFAGLQFKGHSIYPTISLHKNGERVRCNFQGPFVSQGILEPMLKGEKQKLQLQVENISLKLEDLYPLVEEYLLHEGYSETLQAFKGMRSSSAEQHPCNDIANGTTIAKDNGNDINDNMNTLVAINDRRKALGKLVWEGHIEKAVEQLPSLLPNIESSSEPNNISLLLKLHCQCFVEYIRDNRIDEAVNYAIEHLYHYSEQQTSSQMSDSDADGEDDMNVDGPPSSQTVLPSTDVHVSKKTTRAEDNERLLLDTLGLLAYSDPMQSPVRYLMTQEHRRALWQDVQQAVITYYGISPESRIERLMQQLVSVKRACAEESAMGISSVITDD